MTPAGIAPAQRQALTEQSAEGDALNTQLPKHVEATANQPPNAPPYKPPEPLPIGDAAILMAADGYSNGLVKGRVDDAVITIRTAETVRNISFDRSPDPVKLYQTIAKIFETIEKERHMEH